MEKESKFSLGGIIILLPLFAQTFFFVIQKKSKFECKKIFKKPLFDVIAFYFTNILKV